MCNDQPGSKKQFGSAVWKQKGRKKTEQKESFNMLVQTDKMHTWWTRQQLNIDNCDAHIFRFECHNGHHMSCKKDDVHEGAKTVSWEQKKMNL